MMRIVSVICLCFKRININVLHHNIIGRKLNTRSVHVCNYLVIRPLHINRTTNDLIFPVIVLTKQSNFRNQINIFIILVDLIDTAHHHKKITYTAKSFHDNILQKHE